MAFSLAPSVIRHGPEGALLPVHRKLLVQDLADAAGAGLFQFFRRLEGGLAVRAQAERAVGLHEDGLGRGIGGQGVCHCLAQLFRAGKAVGRAGDPFSQDGSCKAAQIPAADAVDGSLVLVGVDDEIHLRAQPVGVRVDALFAGGLAVSLIAQIRNVYNHQVLRLHDIVAQTAGRDDELLVGNPGA